ncbi:MAG: hypothetical protein OEV42_03550 [Deltaproteobacteria bacterium]|nr:hypothetical protein [Deltaproteobacteria bacterium]
MSEAKPKKGEFDIWLVGNMYDALDQQSSVLEALGMLIATSCLTGFSSENGSDNRSDSLRWGIQQIIELYLEKKKRILTEYSEKFNDFDLVIFQRGKNQLQSVLQGSCITRASEEKPLKSAMESFDIVIGRGGPLKGEAEELKRQCEARLKR